jgi:hypothetical protein
MPGRSMGTRKRLSRLGFGALGSVHAASTHHDAICAYDVQTFWPVTRQPSPSGTAQRREIGSGLRLRKSLTPDHFPGSDGGQVPGLLLGGPVTHDRGPDPVDTHVLGTAGFVVGPHLLAQHSLLPHRTPATAMFFRPGQGQQSVGGEQLAERLGGREVSRVVGAGTQKAFWDMCGYQLPQVLSEFDGIGAEVVVHRHPFGNPSSRSAMMLRWISDVPP